MLSRRDKLLIQPWEERRFRDHRQKVQSAVPRVDASAPPPRPHVAVKLKKLQAETDRQLKVQADNFTMLQRLGAVVSLTRIDHRWTRPLPKFQNKVGMFYTSESLRGRLSDLSLARTTHSDLSLARTAHSHDSGARVKCYACHLRMKVSGEHGVTKSGVGARPSLSLPSVHTLR